MVLDAKGSAPTPEVGITAGPDGKSSVTTELQAAMDATDSNHEDLHPGLLSLPGLLRVRINDPWAARHVQPINAP
ncbi:MAG: hypothetical protein K0V04_27740 [Deltaproteobacteria bacterium]|nr:hypothetical protein [Deltaproteobacteria bacterium]